MDQILVELWGLILRAIPTLLLVVLLHFYLKRLFYRPIENILEQRRVASEGALSKAEELIAIAERKADDYQRAIDEERAQIYREQEARRQELRKDQSKAIEQARQESAAAVKQALASLAAEAAKARESLAEESEVLAASIAEAVTQGRAN